MLAGDGSPRGFLLTLSREGMLLWTGHSQAFGVPEIGADGTTLYLTEDTGLSAWVSPGPHGPIRPQHTFSWRADGLHTPTVAPSGLIYALASAASPPCAGRSFSHPTARSCTRSSRSLSGGRRSLRTGTLYQFGGADILEAFDPDGTSRWSVTLDTPTNNIGHAPPVVGDNGDVIVSGTTELSAVRPDGTLRWRQPVRFGTHALPALRWNEFRRHRGKRPHQGVQYPAGTPNLGVLYDSARSCAGRRWGGTERTSPIRKASGPWGRTAGCAGASPSRDCRATHGWRSASTGRCSSYQQASCSCSADAGAEAPALRDTEVWGRIVVRGLRAPACGPLSVSTRPATHERRSPAR